MKARPALPATCYACAARSGGVCGLLGCDSSAVVAERSQQTHYDRGDELALQGDASDRIGIIASGLVKVSLLTLEGEYHLLQILKPGQIVGDICKPENTFSWEAATAARICWINRKTLDTIMQDQPRVYRAYLQVTARQLEDHRLWAASMRGRNTLQRIAFWVLQQLAAPRDGRTEVVRIELTRRDLASLLDMSVETLSRGLHQLSDRGAIRLPAPDAIEVVNTVKLRLHARCEERHVSKVLNYSDPATRGDNPFCISRCIRSCGNPPVTAGFRRTQTARTGIRCN